MINFMKIILQKEEISVLYYVKNDYIYSQYNA